MQGLHATACPELARRWPSHLDRRQSAIGKFSVSPLLVPGCFGPYLRSVWSPKVARRLPGSCPKLPGSCSIGCPEFPGPCPAVARFLFLVP
ncbi:putative hydrolase R7, partial [Frankliniella fusca]